MARFLLLFWLLPALTTALSINLVIQRLRCSAWLPWNAKHDKWTS